MDSVSFDPAIVKDWIFPIIEALAAIAAIILVLIVWKQMKQTDHQLRMTQTQLNMTKQQMDTTLRPWISVEFSAMTVKPDGSRIWIPYKNYGQTPALNIKVRAGASFDHFTKDMLKQKEYTPGSTMLVPNGTRGISIDLNKEAQKVVLSGESYLRIGVIIEYEYAKDGKGEYGLIGEYNFAKVHDKTDIEWST